MLLHALLVHLLLEIRRISYDLKGLYNICDHRISCVNFIFRCVQNFIYAKLILVGFFLLSRSFNFESKGKELDYFLNPVAHWLLGVLKRH